MSKRKTRAELRAAKEAKANAADPGQVATAHSSEPARGPESHITAPITSPARTVAAPSTPAEAQGVMPGARQIFNTAGLFGQVADDGRVASERAVKTVKVRAIRDGYYDEKYRRVGDVFLIDATTLREKLENEPLTDEESGTEALRRHVHGVPAEAGPRLKPTTTRAAVDKRLSQPAAFSSKWMEFVDGRTPTRSTGSNETIRKAHDATLAEKVAAHQTGRSTGDQAVLGD
jgi:hypothetical protein